MTDPRFTSPPPGASVVPGGGALPVRGAFATSEVLPLLKVASETMRRLGDEWRGLRENADRLKAEAKRVRANLIVELRVFGNDGTNGVPIKTSAERNEWADADAAVQAAELAADLAQTVQMAAREAYHDAQGYYETLRQMASVERDEWKREHGQQ